MKSLKVTDLTRESFKEFGQLVSTEGLNSDGGDENFGWYEKLGAFTGMDVVSVNILECRKREMKLERLEYHSQTEEAVFPLGGEDTVIVAAPAGKFDESKLKAFRMKGSQGVILYKGSRHFIPYPIGKNNVKCIVVFKHATGANDLTFDELSESYKIEL